MGADDPTSSLTFLLNGRSVAIDQVSQYLTLLDFIRSQGLTGAKEGCAEGECGACAVALVVGQDGRSMFRVVNSCLIVTSTIAGHEVYTVESLAADNRLTEVQAALAAAGASQCGYCTPGFVMSLFAEQYRPNREGACDPLAMTGNLCRCTGYRPIRDAALAVGPPPPGLFLDRLARGTTRVGAVSTPGFSRPATLDACLAILADDPHATLVAGGSDLGVAWNQFNRHTHLVSLDAIDQLHEFSESRETVRMGAALSLSDIGRQWRGAPDAFAEWLTLFASPAIRHRATLGGNLATASPIGDAAPLLMALDAVAHIAGPTGHRTEPVSSLFTAYRRTTLRPGELFTAVEIPKAWPAMVRFYKVSKRRFDDISTVAAAMALDRDAEGRVRRARFAFGGVAATPLRVMDAERAVVDRTWNESSVERVQRVLDRALDPLGDHRGTKQYRLEVSKSLVERFWWEGRP